jgi:hypothetical protein
MAGRRPVVDDVLRPGAGIEDVGGPTRDRVSVESAPAPRQNASPPLLIRSSPRSGSLRWRGWTAVNSSSARNALRRPQRQRDGGAGAAPRRIRRSGGTRPPPRAVVRSAEKAARRGSGGAIGARRWPWPAPPTAFATHGTRPRRVMLFTRTTGWGLRNPQSGTGCVRTWVATPLLGCRSTSSAGHTASTRSRGANSPRGTPVAPRGTPWHPRRRALTHDSCGC